MKEEYDVVIVGEAVASCLTAIRISPACF